MSYRKLMVMLAASATCVPTYAQPAPPRYRFERVPTEAPSCAFTVGEASDLNNVGAVVGLRCIDNGLFAFVALGQDVRLLPQDVEGNAQQLHLNDLMDVTISVSSESTGRRNLLVLNDGNAVQIDPLPGDFDLTMISLNNSRQVLAHSTGPSSPFGFIPMIWQNGQGTPLSAPPNSVGVRAVSLNENGAAIGWSALTPSGLDMDARAVVWESDTVMELPLPRGTIGSRGRDINDRSDAVFSAYSGQPATCGDVRPSAQPYVWQRGRLRALPPLPIGEDDFGLSAVANDINNLGQVVGTTVHRNCFDPGVLILRATLWRDRRVYDLQELLVDENGAPVTGQLRLQKAMAINDAGQILVQEFFDGEIHAQYFVLTPVADRGRD